MLFLLLFYPCLFVCSVTDDSSLSEKKVPELKSPRPLRFPSTFLLLSFLCCAACGLSVEALVPLHLSALLDVLVSK